MYCIISKSPNFLHSLLRRARSMPFWGSGVPKVSICERVRWMSSCTLWLDIFFVCSMCGFFSLMYFLASWQGQMHTWPSHTSLLKKTPTYNSTRSQILLYFSGYVRCGENNKHVPAPLLTRQRCTNFESTVNHRSSLVRSFWMSFALASSTNINTQA